MFEALKELVGKISDEKVKSEFLAELIKIEQSNLTAMPETLDELLADKKFASLESQYAKKVGDLRNKWDTDLKEKALKEKLESSENPDEKETNTTEKLIKEMFTGMNEKFDKINTDISGLRGEKTINSLKDYVKEKLNKLPPEFSELIDINADTTNADIDKKIEILTQIREADLKKIDGQPNVSSNLKVEDTEIDEFLENKKEELGIKT